MIDLFLVAFLVAILIGIYLALFFALYVMIQIIVCDYKIWKRHKAEKEHYRRMEDKFKNRKLTD